MLLYDAFQALQSFGNTPTEEDCRFSSPLLRHIAFSSAGMLPEATSPFGIPDQLFDSNSSLNSAGSIEFQISSAIESASPHADNPALIAELKKRYVNVTEKPVYAKDVDPKLRGPFGVARIELKEGAKPMHRKFFRFSGERENALKSMISKFIDRG